MKGIVFDIQRFSVHDGPGIRTTVFMKGCPLHCMWCHNPEGLSSRPQLQHISEKCIGCGSCGTRSRLSDSENCPTRALSVCGEEITVAQAIDEILKDKDFYADGGGVTFSGGECLIQADFVTLVLEQAKGLGIHTAIDTSGCVPFENIEKTLGVCDLYLYDVKCADPLLHERYTGVDNALIIENLRKLSETGKEIWIRIPVIPNFNNNDSEMEAIAALLRTLKAVSRVNLIPYHSLGASKYQTLGLSYLYDTELKVSDEELQRYTHIFESQGLTVV